MLIDQEHEAEHSRLLGLGKAAHGVIVRRALKTKVLLIAEDADFAGEDAAGSQFVWARIGNTTNDRLLTVWRAARPDRAPAHKGGEGQGRRRNRRV